MLFALWTDQIRRPTRDLDFLGMGDASEEGLLQTFCDVLLTEVEPDGLAFNHENLTISDIREGQEYSGKRMKIPAKLGGTVLKTSDRYWLRRRCYAQSLKGGLSDPTRSARTYDPSLSS